MVSFLCKHYLFTMFNHFHIDYAINYILNDDDIHFSLNLQFRVINHNATELIVLIVYDIML